MTESETPTLDNTTEFQVVKARFDMLVDAVKTQQIALILDEEGVYKICLVVENEDTTTGFVPLAIIPNSKYFDERDHASSQYH